MRFGLIANLKRSGAKEAIRGFVDWTRDHHHELILCDELRETVPAHNQIAPRHELAVNVDLLVSMGGDGTLLATARAVGASGTPILGVNLGSLGFLTQQTPGQLAEAMDTIVRGEHRIEERMLLRVSLNGRDLNESSCALNDVVIDNGPVSRVMKISLGVNGEDVVTYIADGLVLSTPTGSTAYSLAVGGPIMKPGMDAIIAAAIAPFSLTTRPMIFSGDDRLEVRVNTEGRPAVLTLDGQVMINLAEEEKVVITRAEHRARFVVFPENSYYQLLRSKLNWGVHPRG